MRKLSSFIKTGLLITTAASMVLTSCKKNESHYRGYYLEDGVAYVNSNEQATFGNQEIHQIDVNGNATLEAGTTIGTDINIEPNGFTTIAGQTTINNNINIDGGVLWIYAPTTIKTDINTETGFGKIIIDLPTAASEVTIGNNINFNLDSLIIRRGIVRIGTDLNVNSGVVTVSDAAQLIVGHAINQDGIFYGTRNATYEAFNDNSEESYEEPLPQYQYPD